MKTIRYAAILGLVAVALIAIAWRLFARTDWNGPLCQTLRGADRIVLDRIVAIDGTTTTAFEIKGASDVQELVSLMEIDPAESGGLCDCLGNVLFTFYRGDQLLARLHFHHGKRLSWQDGPWEGDGVLTKASQAAVPAWFKVRGYAGLQESRDRELAEQAQAAAEQK